MRSGQWGLGKAVGGGSLSVNEWIVCLFEPATYLVPFPHRQWQTNLVINSVTFRQVGPSTDRAAGLINVAYLQTTGLSSAERHCPENIFHVQQHNNEIELQARIKDKASSQNRTRINHEQIQFPNSRILPYTMVIAREYHNYCLKICLLINPMRILNYRHDEPNKLHTVCALGWADSAVSAVSCFPFSTTADVDSEP